MSVETFMKEMEISPVSDLVVVERRFLETVRNRIQTIAETFEEDAVHQEEAWLQNYHSDFFQFSLLWTKNTIDQNKGLKQIPEAGNLKKDAKEILEDLQTYIKAFTSCYMHINRFTTLLHDEIKNEEDVRLQKASDIKWSQDIGVIVRRSKKLKSQLVTTLKRLEASRVILNKVQPDYDKIMSSILILHKKDKAAAFQRSFRSALRMGDFNKAKRTLRSIIDERKKFTLDKKLVDTTAKEIDILAKSTIKMFEDSQDVLKDADEKILLHPDEIDMTYNVCIGELSKVKEVLDKYYLTYMQHKLNVLLNLKEKLLVVGTLDSLMVLYLKLIKGLAEPMESIKDARNFENEVLRNAKYLLDGRFQEIPRIREAAEATVKEFRDNREDLEDLKKMELEKVDIDNPQPDTE